MITLGDVAAVSYARLQRCDAAAIVTGIAPLDRALSGQISFLTNARYRQFLADTKASAVILSARDAVDCPAPALVVDNPQVAYARAAALFETIAVIMPGIHPTAWISPSAQVAEDVWVGPHCTIEDNVVVRSGVYIGPNCIIGERSEIGADTRLVAQVTICHRVRLGQRVLVHPGAVIGSDGFGLALANNERWLKIPQLGSVLIGDDVEIGANTTIDRGALDDTVVETGVKLDNQIQVAHNVRIGAHSAIAGCVGIAGSSRIGRHCMLGGGVGIAGHLNITDHVQITGMSLVTKSINEPGAYSSGLAVEPNRIWNKISARLRRIDEMFRRLAILERKNQTRQLHLKGDYALETMEIKEILEYLPHRYPFLLIDRVLALDPGHALTGLKNVSFNEPFFMGHFPRRPIMPGVLIVEALAQATGVLVLKSEGERLDHHSMYYLVGVNNARFKRPVEPGDQLILEVRLDRIKSGVGKFICEAKVNGQLAASANLVCAKREIEL
jgi:UDP-3-O-[3-hydroxymyristoyl] glucosamine N-acyltransferase